MIHTRIHQWLHRHGLGRTPAPRPSQAAPHTKCLIAQCGETTPTAAPAPGWHRDDEGRLTCPEHPPATSCRICGQHKGTNRIICVCCTYPAAT